MLCECRLDSKINDLDTKLRKYKEQISSARTPAAQRAAKQQALRLLKQKKLYEGQRDQMYAQQMNLESTQFMTEQMKDTADQVAVMKQAQHALAQQMQQVKIDDVDELQEQMQDLWVRNMITIVLFRPHPASNIACPDRTAELLKQASMYRSATSIGGFTWCCCVACSVFIRCTGTCRTCFGYAI